MLQSTACSIQKQAAKEAQKDILDDAGLSTAHIGIGVDINETEAAKYPITTKSNWQVRKNDGTIIKP